MSTIAPVFDRTQTQDASVITVIWDMTASADTATPIQLAPYADKTWIITGTFTSATVMIHGSVDGTNYAPLTGRAGAAQTAAAAAVCFTSADRPIWVKPVMGGSGACTIRVAMAAHRVDLPGRGY